MSEELNLQDNDPIHQANIKNYVILSELCRGSLTTLFKVKNLSDDQIYVMKRTNNKFNAHYQKKIAMFKKLNHDHILKYYATFFHDEFFYIIMEIAELCDLNTLLKINKYRKSNFREDEIWDIAYQMLLALQYLHDNFHLIHRDLNLQDLYLTKTKILKLGNLNKLKHIPDNENFIRGQSKLSNSLYLAPEMIQNEPYNYKLDIWGLGCCLYNLCKFDPPFYDENIPTLEGKILEEEAQRIPNVYTRELSDFVASCLFKSPEKRPNVSKLLSLIPEKIIVK